MSTILIHRICRLGSVGYSQFVSRVHSPAMAQKPGDSRRIGRANLSTDPTTNSKNAGCRLSADGARILVRQNGLELFRPRSRET